MNRNLNTERGSALVMSLICVSSLAAVSVALVAMSSANMNEQRAATERVQAEYLAQAGIEASFAAVRAGATGALGCAEQQVASHGGTFWVAVDDSVSGLKVITSTATDDGTSAALELTLKQESTSLWRYAAFGELSVNMDANAHTDSYDSHPSTWATQAVNGSGTTQHASSNGDVGSNGDIQVDQNVKVWGDVACGPESTTTVLGNAQVSGSTAPADSPLTLEPIVVPSYASSGNKTINANTTIASGNYYWPNFTVNASKSVTITGPANVVVNNFQLKSNANFKVDWTNGPVNLYVIDNFILNSNAMMYSTRYRPADLRVNLVSDNIADPGVAVTLDTINFASNSQLYGALYAPNALININSNFQIFGAVIARQLDLDSNSWIHYDESLAADLGLLTTEWEKVACRKVTCAD